MGYDNECILNIQSLPGEYFCPVCRSLVYPNEALQSQCTHVYCKPCLAYVVATTQACPYDGYLVTEADSKPLVESSNELAEHIGKVAVHCLYHRSGCSWQGTLAESTTHCAGCSYGNSPVVCNRCGTQIVHRQVQDHAQICPGVQPQAQAAGIGQVETAAIANQAATQDPSIAASAACIVASSTAPATTATPSTATTASAPSAITTAAITSATASSAYAPIPASASGPNQVQGSVVVHPQAAAQAPIPEQWYQHQHYQQYYQQYPGYDPYQQHYQQYPQYQQQVHPQYVQPQPYIQPQHQPQPQAQPHAQPHLQPQAMQQRPPQPMSQPHPHQHVPAQVPQMQGQQPLVPAQQPYHQALPTPHGHVAGQPFPQAQARPPPPPPQHQYPVPLQQVQHQMLQPQPQQQPHPHHPAQTHPPPQPQQQPHPHHPVQTHPPPQPQQQPHPHHPAQTHPPPQPQMQQTTMQMQPQPQPHPHPQPQLQSASQAQPPHPPPNAVSGYQSYPQPIPGAPQQQPTHIHSQLQGMPPQHPPQSQAQFPPQQPPQMRPPHAQMPTQVQQQPTMPPPLGPHANVVHGHQQVQHLVPQPGQQVSQQPGMQSHVPQHGFPQPQVQAHFIPGQPQQQGAVPSQHYLHPQQSLRPQGPAHIQQPIPGPPQQQLNASSAQGQIRPMMVHQARVPQSEKLPQLPHSGGQGALSRGSPATPKEGAPLPDKHDQHLQLQSEFSVKDAEKTESSGKFPEHACDSRFRGKDENDTIDAMKEGDTQAENDSNNGSEPKSLANEETVNGPMTEHVKEEGLQGKEDKLVDKFCAHEGQDFRPTMIGTAEVHPHPGPDRIVDQMLQPTQQNIHPSQERGLLQPDYHNGNPSRFPQQHSDDRRRMPPGPPPPNQERYPLQHIPSGCPPNAIAPGMVTQRPPASESMYPQGLQPMPQSSQERRLPGPPSYQMQVHGHAMPPNQMAAPGHNIREDFPHQVQTSVGPEPCWPPPHAGAPGPGLPPPPAMAPGMPLHHVEAARIVASECLAQPGMGGPPSGAYETPNRIMGEGPSCIPEDKIGRVAPANAMGAEAHSVRRPGVYDGRQLEPHQSIPTGHALYGQPNINMNGKANKVPAGGTHVAEDRFEHFSEGAYDDRFKPSLDPGRQMVNRREFEDDLKQFPRPTHLGGEGRPRFDGNLSSSRPLEWTPQQSGGALTSWPLPSYQQGAPNLEVQLGDRDRPVFFHENLGRNNDPTVARPGLNLVPEYGRPGNFNREFPDGSEGFPSGGLPGHLMGGLDGHGPHGHGLSSDILGSGSQNVPIHLKAGGFHSHLDMSEPGGHGNLPPHLPNGDPRFNGNFNLDSREGDIDIFEHSRKRKPGNMVLCRLCKIDCGTLEGLEHHTQTRGHLKTAMDIVLSIKQEDMKHKLASKKAIQFEGANKSKKRSFESRGTRQ